MRRLDSVAVRRAAHLAAPIVVVSFAIFVAQCTARPVGIVECGTDADCGDERVCGVAFTCVSGVQNGVAGAAGSSLQSAAGAAGTSSSTGGVGDNAGGAPVIGGGPGGVGGSGLDDGSAGLGGAGGGMKSTDAEPAQCLTTGALTAIGAANWTFACVVLTVASVGGANSTAITGWGSGLTAPWHVFRPDVFTFGPGQPHAPPYTDEPAKLVTDAQLPSTTTFSAEQFSAPSGVAIIVSVVPSGEAITGSSPDFASGPIIPNSLFPMLLDGDLYREGLLIDPDFDGHSVGYDQYSPPVYAYGTAATPADGMSHFIMLYGMNTAQSGGHPAEGQYEFRLSVVDSTGSGWLLKMPFTVGS